MAGQTVGEVGLPAAAGCRSSTEQQCGQPSKFDSLNADSCQYTWGPAWVITQQEPSSIRHQPIRPAAAKAQVTGSHRGVSAAVGQSVQQGTAAFKACSRTQASRAGRCSAAAQTDTPGPGQLRALHTAVDKHVPHAGFGPHTTSSRQPSNRNASKPAAAAAAGGRTMLASQGLSKQQQQHHPAEQRGGPDQQQECCSQDASAGYRASTGYRASAAASEGGRRGSMCTAGTTPRSAAAEQHDVAAGDKPPPRPQAGTAAFKTVSRDQRAAVAAGRPYVSVSSSSASLNPAGQDQDQPREQASSPCRAPPVCHAQE